jgi:hypothetical protein
MPDTTGIVGATESIDAAACQRVQNTTVPVVDASRAAAGTGRRTLTS